MRHRQLVEATTRGYDDCGTRDTLLHFPKQHPLWGAIGLPLGALLHVRQKNLPLLRLLYGVTFQTKLEMAATLIHWLGSWLRWAGKAVWLVADGAYAKRPVLRAVRAAHIVLVSRLRRAARLYSVPRPPRPGAPKKRGRKPIYGKERLSLAKRGPSARLGAC